MEPAHRRDGGGEGQERGRIRRARPVKFLPQPRPLGARIVPPVADHQRPDPVPPIGTDMKHARALGSAQPLVTVAGPVRSAKRLDVDGHLARRVRRIDDRVHASLVEFADDPLDREDRGRRAGDMARQSEPGPRRQCSPERLEDLVVRRDLERKLDRHDARAGSAGDLREPVERGVVLVIRGQKLVAGRKFEGSEDGRHAARGVLHEHQPVRIRTQEPCHRVTRLIEPCLDGRVHERDGFRLEFVGQRSLMGQNRQRAGPERSVVDKRHRRIKAPRTFGAEASHPPRIGEWPCPESGSGRGGSDVMASGPGPGPGFGS